MPLCLAALRRLHPAACRLTWQYVSSGGFLLDMLPLQSLDCLGSVLNVCRSFCALREPTFAQCEALV